MGLAALFVLGVGYMFSGSEVACTEAERAEDIHLRCAFVVAAPPEAVWEAFTRTGEPRAFYFDAVLEAEMRPGGLWRFVTDNRERLLAGGKILALERPRHFAHTFAAADLDDPPSRITVELEPLDPGCRVTLVHDRFPGETGTYRRFRRAHPLALSALKSLLETGELPLRVRLYTAIFKPGMRLFTVRAEPWQEKRWTPDLRCPARE
ncbi:MAG: SRPBCC domain-containing protein [Thermoanaerobaculia bacterium]